MLSLLFARHVCKTVRLYGFNFFPFDASAETRDAYTGQEVGRRVRRCDKRGMTCMSVSLKLFAIVTGLGLASAAQMWPVHSLYLESLVTEALRRESPDTIIFRQGQEHDKDDDSSSEQQQEQEEELAGPYPRICTQERAAN